MCVCVCGILPAVNDTRGVFQVEKWLLMLVELAVPVKEMQGFSFRRERQKEADDLIAELNGCQFGSVKRNMQKHADRIIIMEG